MQRVTRRQVVQGVGAVGLAAMAACGPSAPRPPTAPGLARLGWLAPGSAPTPGASSPSWDAFVQALSELGFTRGQNLLIESRFAAGQAARAHELARELVLLGLHVIVAGGAEPPRAVREATSTTPVVMVYAGDPVSDGLVASLARPGGNLTGLTMFAPQLDAKRLDLLKESLPGLSHVAALVEENTPTESDLARAAVAYASLGIQVLRLWVREPSDLDAAFEAARREGAEALFVGGGNFFLVQRARIVALAAQHRLPATYWSTDFVRDGGLMSYTSNSVALYRRAAVLVDKILRGAKPADLPVEQPTTFEFVINLQTAQALGLTIPPSVLLQATEVIQ